MDQSERLQLRPPLLKDRSFWGIAVTQFLGAFNDNLFKQLILLLSIPVVLVAGANGDLQNRATEDVQGWAAMVFAVPFVLLSGLAGFLSDRFSKRTVIVLSKVAEIGVMLVGMVAFYQYGAWGAMGTWTVLFLMATQSTFFGPGKYGILPELFAKEDLPRANGLILMSTFLAIIFGVVVAGFLFDLLVIEDGNGNRNASYLWIGSAICIGIAMVGTGTSTLIRHCRPAEPDSKLTLDDWGISHEMRSLLWQDRPLLKALLVSCVFWMVSSIAFPLVNRLGLSQLGVNKFQTSLLGASIGLGIMLGSISVAIGLKRLSSKQQVTLGLWGLVGCLILLGFWVRNGQHWLGFYGSFVVLMILGSFAAVYAVPLQVYLQERPPDLLKGRMIAAMNQANFAGMVLAGPIYQLFQALAGAMNWPISSVFWMLALLLIPIALTYRLGR